MLLILGAAEKGPVGSQLQHEGQHVIEKDHHRHHKRVHRNVVQLIGAFHRIQSSAQAEDGGYCQKQKAQHQLASLQVGAAGVDLNMLFPASCHEGADAQHQEAVCDHRTGHGDHHKPVQTAGEGCDAHHQFHQVSQPHTHHAAVAIAEVFAQLIHEDGDHPGQGNQCDSEGQKRRSRPRVLAGDVGWITAAAMAGSRSRDQVVA